MRYNNFIAEKLPIIAHNKNIKIFIITQLFNILCFLTQRKNNEKNMLAFKNSLWTHIKDK